MVSNMSLRWQLYFKDDVIDVKTALLHLGEGIRSVIACSAELKDNPTQLSIIRPSASHGKWGALRLDMSPLPVRDAIVFKSKMKAHVQSL